MNETKSKRKRIIRESEVLITTSINNKNINNKNINFSNIDDKILREIGKLADDNKFVVYAVGGIVRDAILGIKKQDYDFTVVGDSIEFAKIVADFYHSKPVIYEKFLTAMVPLGKDIKLEFVGTRKEIYEPGTRNPIVSIGTLNDDLQRRDFTINTLAVALNKDKFGELVDIFGGIEDIEKKIIRTPLEPLKTFSDDPLRMIRAARFASQLEFEIDSSTLASAREMSNRIEIISQERISNEILKILQSRKPSIGLNYLSEMDLLKYIFPELEALKGVEIVQEGQKQFAHKDVFRHTLKVVDNTSQMSDNVWLRFAALLHDIAKPQTKRFIPNVGWTFYGHEEVGAIITEKIFRRMKLPLEHLPYIQTLIKLHQRPMMLVDSSVTDSAIRRLAFQAGDILEDLILLCKADITTKNPNLNQEYLKNYEIVMNKVIEVQEKDKLRQFESPVRGEEIMEKCNLKPCKAIGTIKSRIEEAILDGIIPNEYDDAKEYFLRNIKIWLKEIPDNEKIFQEK